MNEFYVDCEGMKLRFAGSSRWQGADNSVSCSVAADSFDYLVFMDSRGYSGYWCDSIAGALERHFIRSNKTYLIITRPIELTIWASLVWFLENNEKHFSKIITNMGFVDHTPKKRMICERSSHQINQTFPSIHPKLKVLCDYTDSRGEIIKLYALNLGSQYGAKLARSLSKHDLIVLNTPTVSPDIDLPRKRPHAFYDAIETGNEFNRKWLGKKVIDFDEFRISETYDGVHYTKSGNELVVTRLLEEL